VRQSSDGTVRDAEGGSRRVVLAALAGNLAIAAIKFVAFTFTRSSAMLTEGIHSLVDTADQGLLLVGQARAGRAADPSHPFGYGMETYFWSFIVALLIFVAGGATAVWEGVRKILDPAPVSHAPLTFAVLAVSAVCEGLSFRTAYREYRDIVRGRHVRLMSFLRLSKDPNVFATLLEDGAALAGLGVAAVGIALSSGLGWLWADGAASIGIGLLLLAVAAFLANETRSLIAGEAASPLLTDRVRETLARCTDLGRLVDFKTLHLGPHAILVALRWRFPEALCEPEIAAAFATLQARVRAADERVGEVLVEIAS
jgi:cation diffusion facilitator family transporter